MDFSILVLHHISALGAYESLAGLLVSDSPDGVSLVNDPDLSFRRLSILSSFTLTSEVDLINRTHVRKTFQ